MNRNIIKVFLIVVTSSISTCTISGTSYMDQLPQRRLPGTYFNPCNQLYWYPKPMPDYCYLPTTPSGENRNTPTQPPPVDTDNNPLPPYPIPLPVPVPMPFPPPMPLPQPMPLPHPMPMQHLPIPLVTQIPVGLPMPSNPLPLPYLPLQYPNSPYVGQQIGMVPGLPGLVSKGGGVNVLPFSDAYSDILEKYKNRVMRRRLHQLLRYHDEGRTHRVKRRYKKKFYY